MHLEAKCSHLASIVHELVAVVKSCQALPRLTLITVAHAFAVEGGEGGFANCLNTT
jgi:hypothetical protein